MTNLTEELAGLDAHADRVTGDVERLEARIEGLKEMVRDAMALLQSWDEQLTRARLEANAAWKGAADAKARIAEMEFADAATSQRLTRILSLMGEYADFDGGALDRIERGVNRLTCRVADAKAQLAAIRKAWEGIAPLDMGDYYEIQGAGWDALESAVTGKYEMTDEQWKAMEHEAQ